MNKILLLMSFLLLFSGCSNENKNNYSELEHYNLNENDIIPYIFIDDDGFKHKYAVADITPDPHEIFVYGLFYKISSGDYILLTKMESNNLKEYITKFYEDKLYVLDHSGNGYNVEYTLDKEKITKKELNFNFYKGFIPHSINDIKENYIYYSARSRDDSSGYSIAIKIKCSLTTYECELNEL